jgi:hypothetical protein
MMIMQEAAKKMRAMTRNMLLFKLSLTIIAMLSNLYTLSEEHSALSKENFVIFSEIKC